MIFMANFTIQPIVTYDENYVNFELLVNDQTQVYKVDYENDDSFSAMDLPTISYNDISNIEYVSSVALSDL